MPPDRIRPRQDPVSCESCRKKKLKCNREQPCSNCLARAVPCEFQSGNVPATPLSSDTKALLAENASIKSRLERLEHVVLNQYSMVEGGAERSQPTTSKKASAATIGGDDIGLSSPATTLSNASDAEISRNYKGDFQYLEGIGTLENSRLGLLSADFHIRIESLEQILQNPGHDPLGRCIVLPCETQAIHLFTCYEKHLDPGQHIVHIPTVRGSIEQLYGQLQHGQRTEPNQTVLLLTIMASVAAYWAHSDCPNTVFESQQKAVNVAMHWLRTTLDVLEHVKRSATANIETIQAMAIVVFLFFHIEGFSPKVRFMQAATIAGAKDLGLHKTDSRFTAQPETQPEIVDREVRRRIWWHLASTDWSLALGGGPHEGTYFVNPKQMAVKQPRNISDEELSTMPEGFDRPLSEPTIMAYALQRIRLCEACRHIADLSWDMDPDEIPLDDILAVDREFEKIAAQLPSFLRLDPRSLQQSGHLDLIHPHFILQRYTVNIMMEVRRCKLHLPFLLRASRDPNFAFSRDTCLRAARTVIRIREQLTAEKRGTLWIASFRLCGILHLFFYAVVVLVMDLCVNRMAGEEEARKAEIRDACKMLEEAKQQLNAAGIYIDSLLAILHKHRIRLQGQEQPREFENIGQAVTDAIPPRQSHDCSGDLATSDEREFNPLDFDEIWQGYIDFGSGLDPQNWDALISDLETFG